MVEADRCRRRRFCWATYRKQRAARRAAYLAKLNAKYKAIKDGLKGTKAYDLMNKYGGSDSRLTWAELSAGLVKAGKSPAEIAKYQRHWVKATTFLNLERSANYWKLDTS